MSDMLRGIRAAKSKSARLTRWEMQFLRELERSVRQGNRMSNRQKASLYGILRRLGMDYYRRKLKKAA